MRDLDIRLPASCQAPGEARRQVAALAADLPPTLLGDLQLLVSELVANSVRHAGLNGDDHIDVRARVSSASVRVEVSDPGRGFLHRTPDHRPPEARSGLWLLDKISSRWGIERDGVTRVWFEADLPAELARSRWPEGLAAWPDGPREAAIALIRRYGTPDLVQSDRLAWHQPGGAELVLRLPAAR